jgi:hypothetical protein
VLIWTKFALCSAIVVSTAATASAATKKKPTAHRSGLRVQSSAPPAAPLVNPYSPAATGGGTPGYNQMLERYCRKKWVRDAVTSGAVTMARNDPNSAACKHHAGQTSDSGCARSSHRSRRGSGAG